MAKYHRVILDCLSGVLGNLSAACMGAAANAPASVGLEGIAVPGVAAAGLFAGMFLASASGHRADDRTQEQLKSILLSMMGNFQEDINQVQTELVKLDFEASLDRERVLEHLVAVRRLCLALGRGQGQFNEELDKLQDFYRCFEQHLIAHQTSVVKTLADLNIKVDELNGLLSAQPRLHLPHYIWDANRSDLNRFYYGYRRIGMFGREDAVRRLEEFLELPVPFAWWLVTGPGGIGKSRLAYEFCLTLEASNQWRCGFLGDLSEAVRDNWRPLGPTLILLDYVAQHVDSVRQTLSRLTQRQDGLEHKVRVLLLERSEKDDWYSKLTGGDGRGESIKSSRFKEPYRLPPLGEDDLWRIIEQSCSSFAIAYTQQDTLRLFRHVDPQARPLYAAFAAEALADGRDLTQWTQEHLVKYVLERERLSRWEPAGIDELHLNLLALVTMTKGIGPEHPDPLADCEIHDLMPSRLHPEWYTIMAGRPVEGRYPPLEPDPLGECFVLELLGRGRTPHRKWPQQALLAAAWKYDPWSTAGFIIRCHHDFLSHEAMEILRQPPIADRVQRQAWMEVATTIAPMYASILRLDAIEEMASQTEMLVKQHPDEQLLRTELAGLLTTKASAYKLRGHEGDSQRALDDWSTVIAMPEAVAVHRAVAQLNRGMEYCRRDQEGDWQRAVGDFSAVIDMPGAPGYVKGMALFNRGERYSQRGHEGDIQRAVDDWSAGLAMPDAPADARAKGLFNRALLYIQRRQKGDWQRALDDWSAVIAMLEAPADMKAAALSKRGEQYGQRGQKGDWQRAVGDWSAVIAMLEAPADMKAVARFNRGLLMYHRRGQKGKLQRALDDWSAVIAMPGAPAIYRAMSLYNRGEMYSQRGREGDWQRAVDAYSAINDMADVPPALKAIALFNRGEFHSQRRQEDDWQRAVNDWSVVIATLGAPADVKAKALYNRGMLHHQRGQDGDMQRALDDWSALVAMPDASPEVRNAAITMLSSVQSLP